MTKKKSGKSITKTPEKISANTTTKKKLIHSISQEKGIHPSDVRHVIQAFLDKMTERLKEGDRLEFRDFGVFEVVERKQKIGRNPKKADEPIVIPARNAVKFTPGKKMRKLVEEIS
jgi:integration host factor subunit beta